MFIKYFIFLFIQFTFASFNITCILVAAPKKIPMLTYTIDYFINAYNFNHEGINIDNFYLVKGTEREFPEMIECIEKLRNMSINVINFDLEHEWKEGTETYEKFKNYFARYWAEYSSNFWDFQFFEDVSKESLVNYYNFQAITHIKKSKKDYPDYLLFLEDDVAMKKTTFIELRNQLRMNYYQESALKIAFPPGYQSDEQGYFTKKWDCVWGYWGILLNKEQLRNWDRLSHFLPYGYCGDQYHCMMVWFFDKKIRMHEIWYHFGRDEKIIPRDPKYWNC